MYESYRWGAGASIKIKALGWDEGTFLMVVYLYTTAYFDHWCGMRIFIL